MRKKWLRRDYNEINSVETFHEHHMHNEKGLVSLGSLICTGQTFGDSQRRSVKKRIEFGER